jgi:DNA-binding CsgD family transcriptional regulator
MDREPVFTDFLRPRGLGWGAATAIQVPNGDTLVFDVERLYATGHVEPATLARLNVLRPHLARAALVSARLAFERVSAVVSALDALGLPAAVLNGRGRLVTMNSEFESLIPGTLRDGRERLRLVNADADTLLRDAIAAVPSGIGGPAVASIPVPAAGDRPPLIVHLLPIRRAANDVFAGAHSLLVCTMMTPGGPPDAELLKGLFDLTPAEARIARAIASRQSIDEIAVRSGVSRETVRSQLKSVLAKTGTQRQLDLAVLLCGQVFSPSKRGQ